MENRGIFVPVVWLICSFTVKVAEGENACKKNIEFAPCENDKALTGHVIDAFGVLPPSLQNCQNHCFHDDRCVSYNLGPVQGQIRTCELNSFDNVTFPNDVKDRAGSEYCSFKHPCSSRPCPFGKICIPDFDLDTFKCHDGIWSSWSRWCNCSTTRSRVRVCRNPFTNSTATDCPGKNREDNINQPFQKIPTDCLDALKCGCIDSGVYDNVSANGMANKLYCDQETDGGGWAVIQRRQDGSVDFYRGWQDYKDGFGDLTGEFWLGLDKIHQLTSSTRNRLRVDLEDVFAEYDYFAIDNEANQYALRIGNYIRGALENDKATLGSSRNASDSLASRHANAKFSTKDRDNDMWSSNCASSYKGAWWYTACHDSNLNGLYLNGFHSSPAIGINWKYWKGHYYSAKTADMKIRPT